MVNINIEHMIRKKMLYLENLSLLKHYIIFLQVLSTDLNVIGVYVVRFICRGIENNTRMVIFECRSFNTLLNSFSCEMLNIKLKKILETWKYQKFLHLFNVTSTLFNIMLMTCKYHVLIWPHLQKSVIDKKKKHL